MSIRQFINNPQGEELIVEVPTRITNPLIAVWQGRDGNIVTQLVPGKYDHTAYGIMVADLVRHIAAYFEVGEEQVWAWVDRERKHPTTDIEQVTQ